MENLKAHHESILQIEDLSTSYIIQALRTLGWKARPGDYVTIDGLRGELCISIKYKRLLNRIAGDLSRTGCAATG